MQYRRRFYRNNPIPGAIWEGAPENPILLNADEIIPDDYGQEELTDDIVDLKVKINFLNKKGPKYFTSAISLSPDGSKSMLVCNEQEYLKVLDRNPGEDILRYYDRLKLTGDITEFYNIEKLTPIEQIYGTLSLLGEKATSVNLEFSIYIGRDKRVCCECSIIKYKATHDIKYTWSLKRGGSVR